MPSATNRVSQRTNEGRRGLDDVVTIRGRTTQTSHQRRPDDRTIGITEHRCDMLGRRDAETRRQRKIRDLPERCHAISDIRRVLTLAGQ
ncbi:MAG: hypothetical protein RLZZ461_927, partial [Planctomycetota bacterium]